MKYLWLCCLSLITAGCFIYVEHKEKYVAAVMLKGLASSMFVAVGILSGVLNDTPTGDTMVLGLVLGCVADILLNLRYVFARKGQLIFLAGILVFLSGHIAYLAAILPLIKNVAVVLAVSAVLTALIMIWIFRQITAAKAFKIFGVVYIGAIVAFNCVAFANMIQNPSTFGYMLFAGAMLFLISDIVLILNTFGSETRFSLRITNLTLYYIGQILIALSIQLI